MDEQLIGLLKDRAGLDEDKARQVVSTILDFLKENPEKLKGLISGDVVSEATGALGKLFGRLRHVAGSIAAGWLDCAQWQRRHRLTTGLAPRLGSRRRSAPMSEARTA
ncbi:MAG: hypothetical protein LC118_04390 [Dehalococcoidia bacterium]|nr:hypothetical protein [Dehalococcoidia bacterium]